MFIVLKMFFVNIQNLIKKLCVESIYRHFLPSHSEKVFDPFVEIYLLNFWFICSGYAVVFAWEQAHP